MKESQMIECPWCQAKVESGIKQCPECENEIVEFDSNSEESIDTKPIRGWLLFYNVTCIISIFFICYSYYLIVRVCKSNVEWTKQLIFLTSYNVLHLICLIATLTLIVSKKKYVPKVIVGLEILNLVPFSVNFFMSYESAIQSSLMTGVSVRLIWMGLWVCYFLMSKRVKATFIFWKN